MKGWATLKNCTYWPLRRILWLKTKAKTTYYYFSISVRSINRGDVRYLFLTWNRKKWVLEINVSLIEKFINESSFVELQSNCIMKMITIQATIEHIVLDYFESWVLRQNLRLSSLVIGGWLYSILFCTVCFPDLIVVANLRWFFWVNFDHFFDQRRLLSPQGQ